MKNNFNLKSHLKIISNFLEDDDLIEIAEKIKKEIEKIKKKEGIIYFFGNGGSQSTASHASLDFNKNAKISSKHFNDPTMITCFSNDYGYEKVLKKIVDFYITKKDCVILISVSGNSKNLVNAAKICKDKKIKLITFTGNSKKNKLKSVNRDGVNFFVNHKGYNIVESVHSTYILSLVDYFIGKSVYKTKKI